ncbi:MULTISPECIES: 4-hydroxy-tetrahydrodipicolinate synthase [Flavobacteriaceae]|uniref:4-hydroxy-tetrahydrodipicolinate synthase n=2 Tax=Flavobacteriaceae TaxID=49546 RepID=A0A4Y8AU49_9FLAO|nr:MULTISPECIES: 4-hydroxy-tetrahydrodipicolinate synthase [Flavobacteriaceae]TEW75421.1 4-hydroxy-tetrahydrodipicolinate synthase [Gramella jeungdoensis]GGK45062.1 4-hydroxy-tetrahydrodipicolinate synthase [Lutibacter litoralis]
MKELLGTGVALVTPFNEDKSVDFEGLARLVNYQIDNGVNYLVVLGTTGEPATLTAEEKEQVKATIIKENNGRLPLVLGIGGNNTMAVAAEIKTTDLTAYTAILSVSPYYNKPTQEGIYQHFKVISEVSSKPIILYNVPGRTGKNMETSTILRLANDFENIVAVKEAAGDIVQAMRIIQHKPADFMVISGDDMIALPMVLAGGAGVISVIGQGLPKDFSEMIQLGLQKKVIEANKLQLKIMDSIDYIFEECNPSGIKALLQKQAICSSNVRLPLVKATEKLEQKLSNFIDNY